MSSTGIVVGLKKGYPVEKRVVAPRPSHSKAVSLIFVIKQIFFFLKYILFCKIVEALKAHQAGKRISFRSRRSVTV